MCCVFFREAKPDLRHVQQDGLVCRAFGGACQELRRANTLTFLGDMGLGENNGR